MRIRVLICCLGLVVLPRVGWSTCVVESAASSGAVGGSLAARLAEAAQGGCTTNAAEVIETYKPYLDMAPAIQLIEWRQSMDILLTEPLPLFRSQGMPLVVRALPGVQVRILGQGLDGDHPIQCQGGDAPIILDGMTVSGFAGTAVDIFSDHVTLLRTRIVENGRQVETDAPMAMVPGVRIRGRHAAIVAAEIAHQRGPGVVISEDVASSCEANAFRHGERVRIEDSEIHHNGDAGIVLNAFAAHVSANRIHDNGDSGLVLHAISRLAECALQAQQPVTPALWHTAFITKTTFWHNGDAHQPPIAVVGDPLPPPVDLVVVTPETAAELVLIGNVSRFNDPAYAWNDAVLNFSELAVELFVNDAHSSGQGRYYVTTAEAIDPLTRQFVIHVPQSMLRIEGHQIAQPMFSATLVDRENRNTSPFSDALNVLTTQDWDADGIPNAQEDRNHDGLVDAAETDPRVADSDGDGLLDGDEVARTGYVHQATTAESQALRVVLANPQDLDPRNPDSDGDCLPDGLEMRVDQAALPAWQPHTGSVLQRPRMEWSSVCSAKFRERNILLIDNATPWDPTQPKAPSNVTAIYDADPTTWTDPTAADTDADGQLDGAEDWNIDGRRTAQSSPNGVEALIATAPQWIETDPQQRDSDQDGLADGDEGDLDHDDVLSESETDPLQADTDGDGLADAEETQQFGTKPNHCDTDGDGLSDGLEAGRINPYPDVEACRGLQAAGSNFDSIEALDPLKSDSDNDGLADGEEDSNWNGALDTLETDPSVADTDADGFSDYVERLGDFDHDRISDIALAEINHGAKCAPPIDVADLDCDGLPNARDDDSDNDGCSDRSEADAGMDAHGIPGAFTAGIKACQTAGTGGGGGGGAPTPSVAPTDRVDPELATRQHFAGQIKGGGSCSLIVE